MQVAVLSDLHLGRRDKLDQFSRNPGAESHLELLLEYLEKHVDKIVLLGDIFETLRGRAYRAYEKELRLILRHYPVLAKKFTEHKKYLLFQGNHDLATSKVLNAYDTYSIKERDTKLLFFHGHQVDPWHMKKNLKRYTAELGCWLGGWMERLGMDVTHKGHLSSKYKSLNNLWKPEEWERACVDFGKQHGADIVITGHSHHPMKVEIEGVLFMNSGTRVAGRHDLLILDTFNHEYEMYKEFNPSSQNQSEELLDLDHESTLVRDDPRDNQLTT